MKAIHRAALDRIKLKNGRLMAPDVVEAARPKGSPLHDCFTWDRNKGFEKNLLVEAAQLIAEYKVVIMVGDKAIKTRHFVSVSSDRNTGGGYRIIADVLDDATMKQQLLADALSKLAAFQQRYQQVTELVGVFAAIDEVRSRYEAKKKRKAA